MGNPTTARIPFLNGGLSRQPDETRQVAQLKVCNDSEVSIELGTGKRQGTRHRAVFASWPTGNTYDGFAVNTDRSESYDLVMDSAGVLRIVGDDYSEWVVYNSGQTAGYLATNAGTAKCIACMLGDGAVVASQGINPSASATPFVSTTRECKDFTEIEGVTLQPGQIARARQRYLSDPPGLYRYQPGKGTHATLTFGETNVGFGSDPIANFGATGAGPTINPKGARVKFARVVHNATACPRSGSTITVSIPTYPNNMEPGEQVFISGTGAGAYTIASATASSITVVDPTGLPANVDVRGVGREVEVSIETINNPVADLVQAGVRVQQAFRDQGLPNVAASFAISRAGANSYCRLTVTSNWGGPLAGFPAIDPIRAPSAGSASWDATGSSAGSIFNKTLTPAPSGIVAGTGAVQFQNSPRSRWVPIGESDQDTGQPNLTTLPVKVARVRGDYAAAPAEMGAIAQYRFRDAGTTFCVDELGRANGTFSSSMTASSGVVLSNGSGLVFTSRTMTSTIYRPLSGWGPISFEFWIKGTGAAGVTGLIAVMTPTPSRTFVNGVAPPTVTVGHTLTSGTTGKLYLAVSGTSTITSPDIVGLYSTAWKHVVITFTPGNSGTRACVVNGTNLSVAISGTGSFGTPAGDSYTLAVGNTWVGDIAEFVVHDGALAAPQALWRFNQFNATAQSPMACVRHLPWQPRRSGDEQNNPASKLLTQGLPIRAIQSWQGRLEIAAGNLLVFSAGNRDYTRLYTQDVTTTLDDDPFDQPIGEDSGGAIRSMLAFDKTLLVTTAGRTQFSIGFTEALAPSRISVVPAPEESVIDVQPARMGERAYYIKPTGGFVQLVEYELDPNGDRIAGVSQSVGRHVFDLISTTNLLMATAPDTQSVLLVARGTGTAYLYRTAFINGERRLAAWSVLTFNGADIRAVVSRGTQARLYTLRGSAMVLETFDMGGEATPAGYSYLPRMDGQVTSAQCVSVLFAAGTTTWTLPTGITSAGLTTIVKANGTVLVGSPSGSTVTATGDHTVGGTTLGRPIDWDVQLSAQFLRDNQDRSFISPDFHPREITVRYARSGYFKIGWVVNNRIEVFKVVDLGATPVSGKKDIYGGGPADRTTIRISSSDPRPAYVGGIDTSGDLVQERV